MTNLCNLLLKYNYFSQVEDDIFIYIDKVLENASEIYARQQKARRELACLESQVAEKQKQTDRFELRVSRSPVKKRKVQSLDSPFSAHKENVSILEDSTIFPYKSDSDVSTKLEQNILDSEEPFFALTQSPPTPAAPSLPSPRSVLSLKNESKASPLRPTKLLFADEHKSDKKILRESRFSRSFLSPETSSVIEEKCNVSPMPKTKGSNGKWTSKKPNEKTDTSHTEQTPPTGLKRFHSLADSNQRFRQVKLNFLRQTNHTPTNEPVVNDTLFSDFVVPTPPSVANRSKFLKSLRMKKQSTLISREQNDCSGAKESFVASSSFMASKGCNPILHNDEDDIDQTYCPVVESTNNDLSVKIKKEPGSQQTAQKPLNVQPTKRLVDCVANKSLGAVEDSEANEIIVLPAASQQSIISVAESQNETDKFITDLNEEHAKRIDAMSIRTNLDNVPRVKPNICRFEPTPPQGFCVDCTKLYQFHTTRGVSNDTARSKLPRNCRNCRLAQLHSTPSGFWDPDFLPTPE